MNIRRLTGRLRRERLGLSIITASLLGIAVLVLFIINHLNDSRLVEVRTEGVNLVRLLSQLHFDDLASRKSGNILEALVYASSDDIDHMLYAAVVDTDGMISNQVSLSGYFAPANTSLEATGLLSGENIIELENSGVKAIEFYGPLLQQNEIVGYVRIAYEMPSAWSTKQLPFLATLALIVFLPTTLTYCLFRREFKPIHQLNHKMESALDEGTLSSVSISATGEMAEFMAKFNNLVDLAQNRIQQLEDEEKRLVSDQKLVNYRRGRVEQVLESLPDGVIVFDEKGDVTFVNGMTANLLGCAIEHMQSSDPSQWTEDAEIASFFTQIIQRCHKNFTQEPVEVSAPNSSDKTLEFSARRLIKGQGGAIIVVRDVTQEVLARQSRGNFVAHIAHEIKTPLNTLNLYCEALQGQDGADEAFRLDATNVIADEVERLATLITNLLSISKIEMGSLSLSKGLVKPKDLLQDTFETIKRSCRVEGLEFVINLPADMNPIYADKDMLRVAISNLLTNAIKYNKNQGRVILSANENDDTLVIEVRDTGIGISEQDQALIFDKFYRSEDDSVRSRSGHGLGLSLTRDIVQIHNGSLEVESQPGEGSCFRLILWKDSCAVRQAI